MLNPNARDLYTSAFTPPPGMIFDEAIATTFSLDPAVLLEAPVYLALMATDSSTNLDPMTVLEAIRRYSKRITVYLQKGRIHVPQSVKPNPLFALLEEMIVQVKAPGGGVFHPKIWAIRFVCPDKAHAIYRLVILTRNMTADQSWDMSLQLEGTIASRKDRLNRPLAHFFSTLPALAARELAPERIEQAKRFSEALHRVQWELPEGFDELTFFLPGTKKFEWSLPKANHLAVISPFCSDEALRVIVSQASVADALISRPETLSALSADTLNMFLHRLHLDEAAETDDGDDELPTDRQLTTGLHAKVYVFQTKHYVDYTHVVLGSANATNAALISSSNVEFLVELIGRTANVGGIEELLSSDGMGEYLVNFDASQTLDIDPEFKEAEEFLEAARVKLVDADLSIKCCPTTTGDAWEMILNGEIPSLDGIVSATTWPITVSQDFAVSLFAPNDKGIRLGEFSASSVTGLLGFELRTKHPDVFVRFVLNIKVYDIPEERNSAILKTVISNQDGFIRYLMLLIGDDTEPGPTGPGGGSGFTKWLYRLAHGEDIPLLEELSRTYSRHPERLGEISRLVQDLSRGTDQPIVPQSFLTLWTIFESAIGGNNEK